MSYEPHPKDVLCLEDIHSDCEDEDCQFCNYWHSLSEHNYCPPKYPAEGYAIRGGNGRIFLAVYWMAGVIPSACQRYTAIPTLWTERYVHFSDPSVMITLMEGFLKEEFSQEEIDRRIVFERRKRAEWRNQHPDYRMDD